MAATKYADARSLAKALKKDPELARKGQLVGDAGRRADRASLEVLLRHGADLNALYRGYRPLHALIQESPHAQVTQSPKAKLDCLAWMLEHGADPELHAAWPAARALVIAAFVGARDAIEVLVDHGARLDGFTLAALGEHQRVVALARKDPSLPGARDGERLTVLQCAAGSRLWKESPARAKALIAIATELLDRGANPNARTPSWSHDIDACYLAAGAGHAAMFELMLARGADATSALVSAMWNPDRRLSEVALAHGARADKALHDGKPLLNQLVRWGQVEPALWLVERGASPNVPDQRGWTAVHQAASRGNVRMFEALVRAGGDLERRDRLGGTPAHVAVALKKEKIIAWIAANAGARRRT